MKNDTRISIFNGYGKAPNISRLFVCLGSLLVVEQALAEVGLPPPAQHQGAGFPSERALQQKGYDPKTGVWRVQSQNSGRLTVTKSGNTIKGSQPKTVTATGNYGEKGTFRTTQTQTVSSSKLQNTVNGIVLGNSVGNGANAANSFAVEAGEKLGKGDYSGAAWSATQGVAHFVDGLFGGPVKGTVDLASSFGNGYLNGKYNSQTGLNTVVQQAAAAQAQAERAGDFRAAVANAAVAKAAGAASEAMKQQEQAKKADAEAKQKGLFKYQLVVNVGGKLTNYPFYANDGSLNIAGSVFNDNNRAHYFYDYQSKVRIDLSNSSTPRYIDIPTPSDKFVLVSWKAYKEGESGYKETNKINLTAEDFTLNQKEMLAILQKMLQNNQTNHAELMNQLAKIGDVVEKSTESNQFTPMTADSAPYTPQGSNTPQQTRFTLNADGSVSTSIIPRPDLKPNSTLAPTRSEIIPTPNQPNTPTTPDTPTGQQNQNQENQKQDFCKQNPNTAQCMLGGDSSYEDIKLPEQTIDLNFKPLNVFQSDGKCPAPRSVDFGALGQVEFSYDPLCDLARKLRPIFIAICVLTCAYFVYESVKEL